MRSCLSWTWLLILTGDTSTLCPVVDRGCLATSCIMDFMAPLGDFMALQRAIDNGFASLAPLSRAVLSGASSEAEQRQRQRQRQSRLRHSHPERRSTAKVVSKHSLRLRSFYCPVTLTCWTCVLFVGLTTLTDPFSTTLLSVAIYLLFVCCCSMVPRHPCGQAMETVTVWATQIGRLCTMRLAMVMFGCAGCRSPVVLTSWHKYVSHLLWTVISVRLRRSWGRREISEQIASLWISSGAWTIMQWWTCFRIGRIMRHSERERCLLSGFPVLLMTPNLNLPDFCAATRFAGDLCGRTERRD